MSTPSVRPIFESHGIDREFGWRVGVSVVSVFGLIVFALLLLAFWAGTFTAFQTAAILTAAGLVFVAVNGGSWASWRASRLAPVPRP